MPSQALMNDAATFGRQAQTNDVPANLNSVRGLACLLVVALHVVGDEATNGLHLPMTSAWHYAMMSIEFIRIPLFTAMSGYLYAGRRVNPSTFARFWSKKFRRLCIPLVFMTIVIWLIRRHAYADPETLAEALMFGYGHLWYIQALLLLFALVSIWDALGGLNFTALVLTGLTMVMVSQSGIPATSFISLSGAIYLAPYFLFGIILRERPEWLQDRRAARIALGIIIIVLASQQLGLFGLINPVTLLQLPAAIAGMAGVVFLLQRLPGNAALATIGGYSYTIYLWHVVVSATMRAVLLKAGIMATSALFAGCFVAAVTMPIVLYHVARRIPFLCVAVTGEHRIAATGNLKRRLKNPASVHSDSIIGVP